VFSVRYVLHIYIRSRLISVCTAVQFPVSTLLLHSDRVEQSAKAVLRLTAFQHSLFHNLSVTGLMSLYFCVHVPKSPSWKQKALSSGYSELSVEWVSLLIMKPHCDECNKVVNWSGPVHESRNRHFQFSEWSLIVLTLIWTVIMETSSASEISVDLSHQMCLSAREDSIESCCCDNAKTFLFFSFLCLIIRAS
jgi:hypothetical protein